MIRKVIVHSKSSVPKASSWSEPELDEEWQEIVEEEIQQADGKVKKKKVVRPKMEDCHTVLVLEKFTVQNVVEQE